MNQENTHPKTFIVSAFQLLLVVAIFVGVPAVIYSDFTGVIFLKLGIEGGELLIDKQ